MKRCCFTADPHFGNGLDFRDFGCIEDHDTAFIDGINGFVDKDDELWIVGDFGQGTLGRAASADGKTRGIGHYRQRIKCRSVFLVLGNHDVENKCKVHFSGIYHKRTLKLHYERKSQHINPPAGRVLLHIDHYPCAYWLGSHNGSLHIYGHVHDRRERTLDRIWPDRRSMDCGFDTAYRLFGKYRPFADSEIIDRLLSRTGHDPVEFYRNYKAGD